MVILKKLGSRPHSRPSAEIRLVVDGHYGTEFGAAKPHCAYLFAQSLANSVKALLHADAGGRRNRENTAISVDARVNGESVFAGGFSDADTRTYRRSPRHSSKYSVRNASATFSATETKSLPQWIRRPNLPRESDHLLAGAMVSARVLLKSHLGWATPLPRHFHNRVASLYDPEGSRDEYCGTTSYIDLIETTSM